MCVTDIIVPDVRVWVLLVLRVLGPL